MEDQMCFDCLQRRIHSDFSDNLTFSHAISDSSFPFASTAVVQMSNSSSEASSQFILVYLPSGQYSCLTKYIDEYCPEDLQGRHNSESGDTIASVIDQDQTCSLDTTLNEIQSNGGRRTFLDGFRCKNSTCNFASRFSCFRTITSLAPIAQVGISSYSVFEELASNYFSRFVEDHILSSLGLLIEGKATGRDSINLLRLIGVPAFNENGFPGCLRHPNIAPILGMLKTSDYINLVLPKTPYTLENILHYSPNTLKSEWHIKFLIYQLLSALAHMHGLGVSHGNVCPSNVMLTGVCWSWLRIVDKPMLSSDSSKTSKECSLTPTSRIGCCIQGCPSEGLYADLKFSQSMDWHSAFNSWWRGELSNFEYLLILNRLAGRKWGDHTFHTVMPWVIDFSVKPDETNDAGWRDLSKSKWRLAKGDEQLDFTYSTSEIPHHVSDECLSELAVCSYKARRSLGRPQLYTQSHPVRQAATRKSCNTTAESNMIQFQLNQVEGEKSLILETAHLRGLEEAAAFCEHARHLSPLYCYHLENLVEDDSSSLKLLSDSSEKNISGTPDYGSKYGLRSIVDLLYLLENIEVDDDTSVGYQELLLWRQKSSRCKSFSESIAKDMFSIGCILAEFHLRRPLFDPTSLALYLESSVLPRQMQELPPHTKVIVEACIQKDWRRRPSAKCLLESPYFSTTVRSSYLFLNPLQLLAKNGLCLRYAVNFAKEGAFKAMGPFAAEMCAPYCLSLVVTPVSDIEAEWAYILLKEFSKCLKQKVVKAFILRAIQTILQASCKHAHLETIHPSVISNLYVSPHKSSAAAASVLLIVSTEELGVPVTVHQTILPLIHCFGKGLCSDGIDVLVRIGGLLGENFVVRQILPLLRNVVNSCIDASYMTKPEPMQIWSSLALIDCLMTLDGLLAVLPMEVLIKELIEDGSCLHVIVLMQTSLDTAVLQVAATSLIAICERIGPDLTALHVLPKLKELFDELAFSQETSITSGSLERSLKVTKRKVDEEDPIESRMDLVLLLYPLFASLLGIEKLRQCCATWLLLEQFLLRCHNWKWEYTGESSRSSPDNINSKRPVFSKSSTSSEYNPAKLLLNGVGWSIPQSQGNRSAKNLMPHKRANDLNQDPVERHVKPSIFGKHELYCFYSRSWSRNQGTVQKWDLSRINCTSGYYGHEEVVNDICVLSSHERVASCDGTVHVWNSQTAYSAHVWKLISIFAESSANSVDVASPSTSASKINTDQPNMLNSNPLISGIFSTSFDGSLYTCMHHLEFIEKLVVGTGNGSLRFIDVTRGQKLHLWRSESGESSFPSLISAICACGSDKMQADGAAASPSWIAAGLSSGICRLIDVRSGNIISSWRAHDAYVTKLAAPEEHLLVSSSLDRTLRVWDLRRNLPSHPIVFRGHSDTVSGFSVWGQDVISIAKNKIGLSSLTRSADEDGEHRITPQYLYLADRGVRNMSVLSSLSILPFSRLFLVGTEDGHLKICC
ncbi:Protein GFS12 [Camellia lanceoleosa]|uniref:Protein GFS12 n=1 Tax=Camellia lanceoleosa TaxID=1840588 RepID=A0ACC0F687_9ERIC|nr:Protein GFS12 [Camellia lanceoleosa]